MATDKPITVVIADDHPFLRTGVRVLLESTPGFRVIGEASNGIEAVRLALRLTPDVMLLDMQMPHLNGLEVLDVLRESDTGVRVIVLSAYDDKYFATEALTKGASGYYLKEDAPGVLVEAIRSCVRENKLGISPQIRLLGE